ncbi:hypothetical protein ACHMW6_14340 [Pseudoduganella sp. UC29_106]|uniref:hypothetical protein n=1 Tax=Pseudoduganella sp. UC29_106 TaxID=3374553 RepID=UPI0037578D66
MRGQPDLRLAEQGHTPAWRQEEGVRGRGEDRQAGGAEGNGGDAGKGAGRAGGVAEAELSIGAGHESAVRRQAGDAEAVAAVQIAAELQGARDGQRLRRGAVPQRDQARRPARIGAGRLCGAVAVERGAVEAPALSGEKEFSLALIGVQHCK